MQSFLVRSSDFQLNLLNAIANFVELPIALTNLFFLFLVSFAPEIFFDLHEIQLNSKTIKNE